MKNIVVFSDGTGNSAAKRHRTNVWHMYEALDVHRDDQVAFYDDGVGSQNFWLFKVLGGAFGWGLANNVIDLYQFICRNLRKKPGRWAGQNLPFRFQPGGIHRSNACRHDFALWPIRRLWLRRRSEGKTQGSCFANIDRDLKKAGLLSPCVHFDVDATGDDSGGRKPCAPILSSLVLGTRLKRTAFRSKSWHCFGDRLIFPLRFVNQQLSKKVKRACHALSVDEERHTFQPVLWGRAL